MDAQYLHNSCEAAMAQCPQYRVLDYDTYVPKYSTLYGRIPKKGLYVTLQFWKDEGREILWGLGYSEYLPDDVVRFLNVIEKVTSDAIKAYCK